MFYRNSVELCAHQEVDRLELLHSKLHSYKLFGLPKVPRQLSFHQDSWEEEDEQEPDLVLEDSWQTLLDNAEVIQTNRRSTSCLLAQSRLS